MKADMYSFMRQDLRIARKHVQLSSELSGFSSLCMINAAVRVLSQLAASLISELSTGKTVDEELLSLAQVLRRLNHEDIRFEPLKRVVCEGDSWLHNLKLIELSLNKPASTNNKPDLSSELIASTNLLSKHWSDLSETELEGWCTALEELLESIYRDIQEY